MTLDIAAAKARAQRLVDAGMPEITTSGRIARDVLALAEEVERLAKLLNTPELHDFGRGVVLEAAHQCDRWGAAHDRSKSAENWYWLVGYLGGKALRAAIAGDREKALHHTISAGAALAHWHSAIKYDESDRGQGNDADLEDIARPALPATPAPEGGE